MVDDEMITRVGDHGFLVTAGVSDPAAKGFTHYTRRAWSGKKSARGLHQIL